MVERKIQNILRRPTKRNPKEVKRVDHGSHAIEHPIQIQRSGNFESTVQTSLQLKNLKQPYMTALRFLIIPKA